jgi:glycosyltransferase involved in cell wall biosynthesis
MWLAGQDARKTNHFVKRIKPDGRHIIAFSEFVQEEFSRNFGITPFCVANNGINPDAFPKLNAKSRKYDVLGAGSLIKLKNYSLFVEMMHRLRPQFPSLSAAIAGEGPERPALEAQIARLELRGNLRLLGSLPHPQVLELMNDARIFLHPSSYESNASVLIEALYAGCRVVSFQGLSRAPVENLTVCENEQEMLDALKQLLAHPAWQIKRVLFNSMDQTAQKIISLYI